MSSEKRAGWENRERKAGQKLNEKRERHEPTREGSRGRRKGGGGRGMGAKACIVRGCRAKHSRDELTG